MKNTDFEQKSFKVYMNIKRICPLCSKSYLIGKFGVDCKNRGKKCNTCMRIQGKFINYEPKNIIKLVLGETIDTKDSLK